MATSRSLEEFSRRIKEIKREVLVNAEANIKKAAARALQVAVFATRVDTGRARGGWLVTVGTETSALSGGEERDNKGRFSKKKGTEDKEGSDTINRGIKVVEAFKLSPSQATSIILENNVDYIIYLDEGGPHVGPDNMTKKAVQAALDFLRRSSLLNVGVTSGN